MLPRRRFIRTAAVAEANHAASVGARRAMRHSAYRLALAGGVPVVHEGRCASAVGVSGGASEADHEIASVAAKAILHGGPSGQASGKRRRSPSASCPAADAGVRFRASG
jgi:Haem-degrading